MSGIVFHIDGGFVELFWFCYSVNTAENFLLFYGWRESLVFGDTVRGGRESVKSERIILYCKKMVIGRDLIGE